MSTAEYNDLGLNARVVGRATTERVVLSILYLMIYISYAGLGRDIFFNHLNSAEVAATDPIGAVLPFVRVFVCFAIFALVVASSGLSWALSKVPLMFAPFWLLALASCLWSAEPKDTLRNALMLVPLCVAMPIAVHRLGVVQSVRLSVHLIAGVCIASALLAILVPSIGKHTGMELVEQVHAGRWRGIFSHKNGLGPWAAYGAVFVFTHSRLAGGPQLYWWLARASALACLIFSGSVTAIVLFVFLVYASFFAYLLRRYRLPVVMTFGVIGPVLLLMAAIPLSNIIFELLGRDSSLTGRTEIWALAPIYFMNSPWIGHGYLSLGGPEFLNQIQIYFAQAIPGPESGYWTLLLDLGLIGFLCFMIPFYASMRNGFEWLKFVKNDDRSALEFFMITLASTLILAITESNALLATGFDGIIAFAAFFALQTTPKSPRGVLRGEFRMAKYWAADEKPAGNNKVGARPRR